MSEYIEIESEEGEDPTILTLEANVLLAPDGLESYDSVVELEEGSPLAQAMAMIPGIIHLQIDGNKMVIHRERTVDWYAIVEDITAAIKDFFL
jgi:hypothetical protein